MAAPKVDDIILNATFDPRSATVYYYVDFDQSVLNLDDSDFVVTTVSGDATGDVGQFSVSGSTNDRLITVENISGDGSIRLDIRSGTDIENSLGEGIVGGYTNGEIQTVVDDVTSPTVTAVNVPADATYLWGETLTFEVVFDETVLVDTETGTPHLDIVMGDQIVEAAYESGTLSDTLTFTYDVQIGDVDEDGIAIQGLNPNGGSIADGSNNIAKTTLNGIQTTSGVTVDAVAPTVTQANIAVTGATGTGGTFIIGDTVTVTWDNTATGDGNSDEDAVTVDFSAFGGGADVAATESGDVWTATYMLPNGTLEASGKQVSVEVSDDAAHATWVLDDAAFTVDNQAPLAPNAPQLNPASDTGAKGDGVTEQRSPVIIGTAEAGATVAVVSDIAGKLGSATADGAGDWKLATGVSLGVADHQITYTVTDAAGNTSASSPALALEIVSPPRPDPGPELVEGSDDPDLFIATDDPQRFEGGAGDDTVVYRQPMGGVTLLPQPDGSFVVERSDGTRDTLVDIEHVQFENKSFDFTVADQIDDPELADQVIELYVAYFNRVPEASGLLYWLDQIKNGLSLDQTANAFFDAALQYGDQTGYGPDTSSDDLISSIYANVLGRAGDTAPTGEEIEYWRDQLDSGEVTKYGLIARMLGDARDFSEDIDWGWVSELLDNKLDLGHTHAITFGVNYSSPEDAINSTHDYMGGVSPEGSGPALDLVGVSFGELEE